MLGFKTYYTVIMDGTNKKVNREILGIFDMMTIRRKFGKFARTKTKWVDKDHPTMRVIKTFTSAENYRNIRRIIEEGYPGLCNFDVPM